MRTLTLARMGRALMIAAAMIMLPQLASAQLPVTTKSLVLQDADAGGSITINPASDVTSYTLTLPATKGPLGSFLYSSNTDGGLSWSNAPTAAGWTPRWSGSAVEWIDPAGASNPNWSLTGNADAAGLKLGVLAGTNGFDLVTNNTQRMTIEGDGDILINNATGNTSIGRAASTLTVDAGTVDINGATTIDGATIALTGTTSTTINAAAGATNINTGANAAAVAIGNTTSATMDLKAVATTIAGTTLGITAATTQTGDFNLVGELQMGGAPGTSGDVLVSKGDGNTPAWESITEAVGIRNAGVVSFTAASKTATAISVADLAASDAIIVTVEQPGNGEAAVTATVTNRTVAVGATPGTFHITLSGVYTGSASYMVVKQK